MWDKHFFRRLDFPFLACLASLMVISLLVISSTTAPLLDGEADLFFTPYVKKQLQYYALGWALFLFLSAVNYHKLREWSSILYVGMLVLLVGLFFVPAVQHVHRWYRFGPIAFQPSEHAKLALILTLSWFLERRQEKIKEWKTTVGALTLLLIPCALILKQPDLGTAFVLFPIGLGLFYFGGIHRYVIAIIGAFACVSFLVVSLFFLNIVDHDTFRPMATKVLKEYQYERLNPNTYHQQAAKTAIALGGVWGTGWKKSEFTRHKWLPAAHTDSVFPAFAEEFGVVGTCILLALYFGVIFRIFQIAVLAQDTFGRLLAAGIAIYLGIHIVINLGMMCGLLPITGVPLVLVSYGGSSIMVTMGALGVVQSIYRRRFLFV